MAEPVRPGTAVGDRGPAACPMCGEMIIATAAKCRFCGEVFDPSKKQSRRRGAMVGEDLTTGDIVALLCSGIGCIAGIVWMIQGKPKGLKMFGLSFAMAIILERVMMLQSTPKAR